METRLNKVGLAIDGCLFGRARRSSANLLRDKVPNQLDRGAKSIGPSISGDAGAASGNGGR